MGNSITRTINSNHTTDTMLCTLETWFVGYIGIVVNTLHRRGGNDDDDDDDDNKLDEVFNWKTRHEDLWGVKV
jgi:hypothetical protein